MEGEIEMTVEVINGHLCLFFNIFCTPHREM